MPKHEKSGILKAPRNGREPLRDEAFISLNKTKMYSHISYGSRQAELRSAVASPVVTDNHTLISEYLAWKSTHTTAAAKRYAPWVSRFQEFTNKAPESLTIGDWTAFALSLQGRFAPKCVEFALNIIHNYLRFWHEQGRLRLPLYLARVKAARACSHNSITEDEYRRLIEVLELRNNLRDLVLVRLLHDTGVRVGELARIEIEQIEEDASAVIETEKTVQRRRVFWNQDTDEVLHRYLVERINDGPDTDWLFAGRCGSEMHLTSRSIERIVEEVCAEAGMERRLTPHSFRHAFIHRMAMLGTPDAIIAQLVGHATPHTISHYTKLSRPEAEGFARRQFKEEASHKFGRLALAA